MGRWGGFGYIPDLAGRERRFGASAPTASDSAMPEQFDLSAALPGRLNQISEGSCVAHSVTSALRYNWLNTGQADVPLSRNQLYYDARALEGTTASDAGCQIRNAVKIAQIKGVCDESLWPYDVTKWMDAPPDSVYADAITHEAVELYGVDVSPLAIRMALWVGHPVIIGISVYPSFEDDQTAATGIVRMPGSAEHVLSGHSMLVFARKAGFFGVRNWWGTEWGCAISDPAIRGDCWIPETYFTPEYAADLWVLSATEVA